jgi:hypothetical protein
LLSPPKNFVAIINFIRLFILKWHKSGQLVRYDRLVVKSGVHAAGNQACAPELAPFKLRCYQQGLHLGAKLRSC